MIGGLTGATAVTVDRTPVCVCNADALQSLALDAGAPRSICDEPIRVPDDMTRSERLSEAALLETARALAPRLRERIPAAEEHRRLPEENIEDLRAAGLIRVFQASRFGGPELPMQSVLKLVTEVARGCPSTAWVLAVLQIHEWIMGLYPQRTQNEVFGADPDVRIAGVLQPRTSAERVEGGYAIAKGRWPFGSGCDFGHWALVGALETREGAPPEPLLFLIAPGEWGIHDDWHVVGLRGTGSKSLTVEDVFVPEHRVISMAAAIRGELAAGRPALYRSAFVPMLALNVTGPAIGAARTAVEAFESHIKGGRPIPFTLEPQIAARQTHRLLGEAMIKIDAAELLLGRAAESVRQAAEAGITLDVRMRARARIDSAWAVRQCVEAIELLYLAGGGGVLQESHPLQRLQRDVHAMNLHGALNLDANLELYGAITLGQPSPSSFV
jgi:3-hydroxy-9,10-secoandrosta-1,3,5(10)-triene-9,17-dione monooxygenase